MSTPLRSEPESSAANLEAVSSKTSGQEALPQADSTASTVAKGIISQDASLPSSSSRVRLQHELPTGSADEKTKTEEEAAQKMVSHVKTHAVPTHSEDELEQIKSKLSHGHRPNETANLRKNVDQLLSDQPEIVDMLFSFAEHTNHGNRERIIDSVLALPKEERYSLLENMQPFNKGFDEYNASRKLQIYEAIAKIPRDERQPRLNAVKPLLLSYCQNANADGVVQIIETIAKIDKNELQDVLELAKSWMTEGVSTYLLCELLSNLGKVNRVERHELFGLATQRPYFATHETFNQLFFLNGFLVTDKKTLSKVMPFFNDQELHANASLLRSVHEIEPLERLDEVLEKAKPLLVMHQASSRGFIIKAFATINPERLDALLVKVKPYLEGQIKDIGEFLIELNKIDLNRLDAVLLLAKPLLENSTDHTADLIITLAALPPDSASEIINLAARLIPFNNLAHHIKNTCIQLAAQLVQEHSELIDACLDWCGRLQNTMNKLDVLSIASGMERSPRDALQRIARANPEVANEMRECFDLSTSASAYDSYDIEISKADLQRRPIEFLNELDTQFRSSNARVLRVRFIGEPAGDAGGVGREYVTLLTKGVLDELKIKVSPNGLYRPMLSLENNVFQPLNTHQKDAYRRFGTLMMFCLNASKPYPIAKLFDAGLLSAITKFQSSHLERDFDELINDRAAFNDLFSIYERLHSGSEEGRLMIKNMKLVLEAQDDDDIAQIVSQNLRPELAPLFEMAKGMQSAPFKGRNAWAKVQKMGAEELSNKLQGKVEISDILKSLSIASLSAEEQQWIREWVGGVRGVGGLDKEKAKKFLFAMTGAYALGDKATLKFEKRNVEGVSFHTCYNSVDLPFGLDSKEALIGALNFAIGLERFTDV